ncbi:hypothetical protein [Streptomyces sp. SID9727]|uniref:hypothetical protein n=1 Tax=Streptomyces sp. SID9727 TaxID=2706114 RepID=UPI001942D932|nr:hypothetical protein [Streptomyces sp. SID9727]
MHAEHPPYPLGGHLHHAAPPVHHALGDGGQRHRVDHRVVPRAAAFTGLPADARSTGDPAPASPGRPRADCDATVQVMP